MTPRPIIIIGAGGIVNDAHLPAYQQAGFEVAGIYDLNTSRAQNLAEKFKIATVFKSLDDLVSYNASPVLYDLAVPGSAMVNLLEKLPAGASVLLQKPMGDDMEMARNILRITREKKQVAAVNFQLRYAPFILAVKDLLAHGKLGEICDIEVNVNVFTPWHMWKFLYELPRVEILYHSIHYVDLVRSFLGNPAGIYAKTTGHPEMSELASVKTSMILDYGSMMRANILTNHCHKFGLEQQHSYIKIEGTRGAIKIRLGVLMNYPTGVPDLFEYILLEEGNQDNWKRLPLEGSWFPHAFIGSMSQLMLATEGSIARADNSVEDAIHTMACVEAAYQSSSSGAVPVSYFS